MWLVRHLELIRIITLEDLRIAKTLCKPVFPDHYEILDFFINTYHEVVSIRVRKLSTRGLNHVVKYIETTFFFQLEDIIAGGLEGQEYVTFLSWIIQTYPGKKTSRFAAYSKIFLSNEGQNRIVNDRIFKTASNFEP